MVIKPAIEGGSPIRESFLPYGRHLIDDEDIKGVSEVLKSNFITTGPITEKFENAFSDYFGCKHAVAVSSGTSAIHLSLTAAGVRKGDEVITTPMTFCSTANAILFCGAKPVFADINEDTLNINIEKIKEKITDKTKVILPVHYAGQPCDMKELRKIAEDYHLRIVEDAAHAIGSEYNEKKTGSFSEFACFSFHPVKNLNTAEGGMIATNNKDIANKLKVLRLHGISKDFWKRLKNKVSCFYDMAELGFKYNLTDIQASLGLTQLKKLEMFQNTREKIARGYTNFLNNLDEIEPLRLKNDVKHAWHLYVAKINPDKLRIGRNRFITAMNAENIGMSMHYKPVYLHSYYQKLGYKKGLCPIAEDCYSKIITLPLFQGMTLQDIADVKSSINKLVSYYSNNPGKLAN